MTTVPLARHGETTWNRQGRIQGWAASDLSERGREQARMLGERVAAEWAVEAIVSSDLPRARETTEHVRESVGAEVGFDPGWRERDFGAYQGFTYDELGARTAESPDEVGANAAVTAADDGEDLSAFRERVVGAWDRLVADAPGTVLVVTHGGPLSVVLGHVEGLGIEESVRGREHDNCALTVVDAGGDPAIRRENDTAHL